MSLTVVRQLLGVALGLPFRAALTVCATPLYQVHEWGTHLEHAIEACTERLLVRRMWGDYPDA